MTIFHTYGRNPRRGIPKPAPSLPAGGDGSYEPAIKGLAPAIYLEFRETSGTTLADDSGNGRNGTLGGTGATLAVTTLAGSVGSGNKALDLGGAAFVTVPHAAVDTALATGYASPWDGNQASNRFVASCTISIWFNPQTMPAGSNKAVIVSKSANQTPGNAASYDGSFEAYFDANGAVHVEVRSFRGRPCRIRTPNGAVTTSTTYHLTVQLSYDGVAAWLNGAKFEDGYANLLHVYGLAAECWGWTGSVWAYGTRSNANDWIIGKAAWGGLADIIVDEFAVFLHTPAGDITQANVNTLSQQGSTPSALAHWKWGAQTVNESSYANIQAAIDDVSGSGGGTVLVDPGSYTVEGDITLKTGVRLKANGGTVTLSRIRTQQNARANLGAGSGAFGENARTISVTNTRAVGDVVVVKGEQATGSPLDSPVRHDRRWNTNAQSNDKSVVDAQTFEIESRDGSSMTFVGPGHIYNLPLADRDSVEAWTPTEWVALEGDIRASHAFNPCLISQVKHGRFIGMTLTNTSTSENHAIRAEANSIYCQFRNVTLNQTSGSPQTENDGLACWNGPNHIVWKDCDVFEGRHGHDWSGNSVNGVAIFCEFHNCTWENQLSTGAGGAKAAFGIHGPSAYGISWNNVSDWGGPDLGGWRHDMKWLTCGDAARASSGNIGFNDGSKETYVKHIRILRPANWFVCGEGVVAVDNCHFENITRSLAHTGDAHVDEGTANGIDYGTGGLANTYTNVAAPSGSWTEV